MRLELVPELKEDAEIKDLKSRLTLFISQKFREFHYQLLCFVGESIKSIVKIITFHITIPEFNYSMVIIIIKIATKKSPIIEPENFNGWDTIEWENGYDICPEVLYESSKPAIIKSVI